MIKTVQNINFDLLSVLSIIKENNILKKMFDDNISTDIKFISYQYKNSILNKEVETYIRELFDQIILKDEKMLKNYLTIFNEQLPPNPVLKVSRLPKCFGKSKILKKIEYQEGVTTPIDEYMLSLNDLRNAYEKMLKVGIHDIHREDKKSNDEEYIKCTKKIKKFLKTING